MRLIFLDDFVLLQERYSSFESGIGKDIADGKTSFEELEVIEFYVFMTLIIRSYHRPIYGLWQRRRIKTLIKSLSIS